MTTVIAVLIAVVAALIIAIPVTSKVAVSRKVREDQAKIGSAEEKARQIIDDALKEAEEKKESSELKPLFEIARKNKAGIFGYI